jgi:hypothetical protein
MSPSGAQSVHPEWAVNVVNAVVAVPASSAIKKTRKSFAVVVVILPHEIEAPLVTCPAVASTGLLVTMLFTHIALNWRKFVALLKLIVMTTVLAATLDARAMTPD